MNTDSTALPAPTASRPHLDHKPGMATVIVFVGMLATVPLFAGYILVADISDAGGRAFAWAPCILLGVARLIALSFEFVTTDSTTQPTLWQQ